MRREHGFTLFEIVVVMIIIALVAGAVVIGAGALPSARVKSAVRDFVAIVRYGASHAKGTGLYTRIVLNLDTSSPTIYLEEVPPGQPTPPMDPRVEEGVDPAYEDWPPYNPDDPIGPVGADDDGYPFRPPEIKWERVKGRLTGLRAVSLKGVNIEKVVFPEMELELSEGKAAILFNPEGFTHEAFVYLYAGGREGTLWIRPWGDPKYFPGHKEPEEVRR